MNAQSLKEKLADELNHRGSWPNPPQVEINKDGETFTIREIFHNKSNNTIYINV